MEPGKLSNSKRQLFDARGRGKKKRESAIPGESNVESREKPQKKKKGVWSATVPL